MTTPHSAGRIAFPDKPSLPFLLLLCLATAAAGLLILNRWLFTDMGVASYGRTWHLYVSYMDFGFARRMLEGTVIQLAGLGALFKNEYHLAYFAHSVLLLTLSVLVFGFLLKHRDKASYLLCAVALLSPGYILHYAYDTGNPDVLLAIIISIIALYNTNYLAFAALTVLGVLTHELFVFLFPFALFIRIYREPTRHRRAHRIVLGAIRQSLPFVVALAAVLLFGALKLDQYSFESTMLGYLPNSAFKHGYWSGYFELSSSVHENRGLSRQMLSNLAGSWPYIILPTAYPLIIAWTVWRLTSSRPVLSTALVGAILLPFSAVFLADDYYRWVALSSTLGVLALMVAMTRPRADTPYKPDRILVVLALFSLLGPFGAAGLQRPFPVLQLMVERLF